MKRFFFFMTLLGALAGWPSLSRGANPQNPAAAAAAQEEAEDRFRRLSARIEEIQANQDLLRQKLEGLEKGLRDLSEQLARSNSNNKEYASHEALVQLSKQLQKVDDTRVADNKRVFESIDEIHRAIKGLSAVPPPRPVAPTPPKTTSAPPSGDEEGFPYTVQKGDTLDTIVQEYRKQNIKVTRKAVMDANPTVKWERLKVGQKLFIPKPKA